MINAPNDEDVAAGTRAIPQLTQVLSRLGSASDSAWAYLALASAYGMAERPDRACEPFRRARRLIVTPEQRANLDKLSEALTCAP